MAKKRVSKYCLFSLVLFLTLPLLLASVAARGPIGGGGGAGGDIPGIHLASVPEENTKIYWKACYKDAEATSNTCIWHDLLYGQHPDISAVSDTVDGGAIETYSTVDIKELYNIFSSLSPVPEDSEITKLKFVLGMQPFDLGLDYPQFISSHGGYADDKMGLKASFEGATDSSCLVVNNIDRIDQDITSFTLPFAGSLDWTCIEADILSRDSCDEMADWTQEFCEGIDNVYPNTGVVSGIGTSSLGGCQQVPDTANSPRSYGRDWYTHLPGEDIFPDDFRDDAAEPFIDRCCGNDGDLDIGAIAKNEDTSSTSIDSKNTYLCYNDTIVNPAGDMKWAFSQDVNNEFNIIPIRRFDMEYDMISNVDNWFACVIDIIHTYAPVNSLVDDWQPGLGTSDWTSGIGVAQYQGIPHSTMPTTYSTDAETEDEDILDIDEGEFNSGTGTDDPPMGSGSDGIITEDNFNSDTYDIDGPTQITACDMDGDGYDSNLWSSQTGAGDPMVKDENTGEYGKFNPDCKNPRAPYDCDDNPHDDLNDHGMAGIARMKHPGATDFCQRLSDCEGGDCDLDCNLDTDCHINPLDSLEGSDENENDAKFQTPRYLCNYVGERGQFTECCGFDLSKCRNPDRGVRVGTAVHTLREFDRYGDVEDAEPDEESTDIDPDSVADLDKTNFVLRYKIERITDSFREEIEDTENPIGNKKFLRFGLFTQKGDLNITNWGDYKFLEFYILFTANYEVELWVGQFDGTGGLSDFDNYIFPVKFRIVDYVVNEPELEKWLHVVIPTNEIMRPEGLRPDVLAFVSDGERLLDFDTVQIAGESASYSNIVGVDKISLRPYNEPKSQSGSDLDPITHTNAAGPGAENAYCTATWPPTWIKDLDEDGTVDDSLPAGDNPAGRFTCDSIPSYGWTGNMCCGDDTGRDAVFYAFNDPNNLRGRETFKEYYSDTYAGCWAGNKLAENSRVMMLKYDMYSSGQEHNIQRSCRNYNCSFELPPMQNVLITNEYPELYDLLFTSTTYGRMDIGAGALAPSDKVWLKAENVPLQILYFDEDFHACNAVDEYFDDLTITVPPDEGDPLISDFLRSEGPTCEVLGDYFCEHEDSRNLGWSDTPVKIHPDAEGKLTAEDGSEITIDTDDPGPTRRIHTKRNYNLVKNGGFENV
ncbi:hypothetical protein ACFL3V_01810 [Nanoarchaeota archaeon]